MHGALHNFYILAGVEKRHARRQDKAKSDEKAQFMCNKCAF